MTLIVCDMTEQSSLDRAQELVIAAESVIDRAVQGSDEVLELLNVTAHTGPAGSSLMAAGALPDAVPEEAKGDGLSAAEAAGMAARYLRGAAEQFPAGAEVDDDVFEALAEMWAAIRELRGWF